MKISNPLAKLTQPLTYRRSWRRVRRWLYPIPEQPLLAKVDQQRIGELRARCASLPPDAPDLWRHYGKYLEVDKRIRINIERAQDLNLHRLPPKRILDLGCGGGFFLYVADSLGHEALGLDVPGIPIFDGLIDLFGVRRIDYRIAAQDPLPDLGQFDLITAFATAFHGGHQDGWRWQPADWDFFVADLMGRLNPSGRIFLDLNAAYQGHYYTPEILKVLLLHDARVERGFVTFLKPD